MARWAEDGCKTAAAVRQAAARQVSLPGVAGAQRVGLEAAAAAQEELLQQLMSLKPT